MLWNMKTHRHWFLIVGLLAVIYFWGYKNRNPAANPDAKLSSAKIRSLKLIEERILLEKASPSPSSAAEAPFAHATQKAKVPEKSCWEKIRDQYQTNPDYLASSRQHLNEVVGDWYYTSGNIRYDKNIEESSPQGKFFLALANADLLAGAKIEPDENTALLLLEQVAAIDPQNSAPYLYAAIIESRRGNRERAKELLKGASQSTHFDSYIKDFTFALFDGVKTPSDLLAAQDVWSRAPVPNYIALRAIINESKYANIAEQLVQDGLRVDRERITDLSWSPIEYAVGKKLLDSYGARTNIPEYRELLLKSPSTLKENGERAVSKLDSSCDLESIEDEVAAVRSYVERARTIGL